MYIYTGWFKNNFNFIYFGGGFLTPKEGKQKSIFTYSLMLTILIASTIAWPHNFGFLSYGAPKTIDSYLDIPDEIM